MKKIIIILLLIPIIGFSQQVELENIPRVQTEATYTTEVIPDEITLSIVLSENDTKGKISIEELERKLEKVLKSNNIDVSQQLTILNVSSNFRDYFLRKTDVEKTKSYLLVVNEAKLAGKILRELENENISNVRLSKTEYSKLEELKIELKGKAVLKAKKQAEEMVKRLNQSLGNAICISDVKTDVTGFLQGRVAGLNIRGLNSIGSPGASYENKEKELNIEFEKIRVEATVTVYFELK